AAGKRDESEGEVLELEENMNLPPRIVTRLGKSLVFDLNPQLQSLHLSDVQEIKWQRSNGSEVTGGLYYPRDYKQGNSYPLVVQTHGFNRNKFWISGPWNSGFAAQALASRGFFVLQVEQTWYGPDFGTQAEVDREVESFETGVDYL